MPLLSAVCRQNAIFALHNELKETDENEERTFAMG